MLRWLIAHQDRFIAPIVLIAIVGSFVVSHHQVVQNDRQSQARSVDTCRRSNPGRAYLQVRAKEFVKTDLPVKQSYTTKVSPEVFAILNCKASVEQGHPVPLPASVQQEYLAWFEDGYVPLTRGPKIVGKVPFDVYFHEGVEHP